MPVAAAPRPLVRDVAPQVNRNPGAVARARTRHGAAGGVQRQLVCDDVAAGADARDSVLREPGAGVVEAARGRRTGAAGGTGGALREAARLGPRTARAHTTTTRTRTRSPPRAWRPRGQPRPSRAHSASAARTSSRTAALRRPCPPAAARRSGHCLKPRGTARAGRRAVALALARWKRERDEEVGMPCWENQGCAVTVVKDRMVFMERAAGRVGRRADAGAGARPREVAKWTSGI